MRGKPAKILTLTLIAIAMGTVYACRDPAPVTIGFLGNLSGKNSDLGKDGRDGVLLAIDEANAGGGVAGHPVRLVVRDDLQTPDGAKTTLAELITAKPAAIIGPMISGVATAVAPIVDEARIPLVSPTVAAVSLSGKDDWFLRVYPSVADLAAQLAELLVVEGGPASLAIIRDRANDAFTATYAAKVSERLTLAGGSVGGAVEFHSASDRDFAALAEVVKSMPASRILVLAGGADTALIAQSLRRAGDNRPLVASEWSSTKELIQLGGSAVDGMVIVQTVNPAHTGARYQDFAKRFAKRFGRPPGFAAAMGYEAASAVLTVLPNGTAPDQVRRALLAHGPFDGLQTRFAFDAYGDVQRRAELIEVRDGQVRPVER